MSDRVKQRLFLAVRIIIPIILIVFLFRNLDWKEVLHTLKGYPFWILVAAVIINAGANILFAARWFYLLKTVKVQVSFIYLVRLVFYSLFFSNFLPTTIGGDLVKVAGILNHAGQEKKSIKVTSVVADRVFSFTGKILLLPVSLFLFRQYLSAGFDFPWLGSSILIGWIPKSIRTKINKTWIAIRPWFHPGKLGVIFGISWIALFMTLFSLWMVINPLNSSVAPITVFCIILFTYFASVLPISINGIGVQEGSITYLLTLVGFTYEQGIAAALMVRMVTLLVSLVGGVMFLFGGKDLQDILKSRNNTEVSLDVGENTEGSK